MTVSPKFAKSGSFSKVGMQVPPQINRSNSAPVSMQQNTKVTRGLTGEHKGNQPVRTLLQGQPDVSIKQEQVIEKKTNDQSNNITLQGRETRRQPDNDNPIMQNTVTYTDDFLPSVNLVSPMPGKVDVSVLNGTNLSSNVVNMEKGVTLQSDVTSTVVKDVTSTSFWSDLGICFSSFFRGVGTVLSFIGDGLGCLARGLWWLVRNGAEFLGYALCCICWCLEACGDD